MEIDIIIDSLTNCLICSETGEECDTEYRLVAKTITKQDAAKLKEQGWKFDWSIPHRNGYEVYELLLEDDNVVQGRIALKHVRDQFYTHVDIVEAAVNLAGMQEMRDMYNLLQKQIWWNIIKRSCMQ